MSTPAIDVLVLDAAPLLSLSPLRGLAKTYVTTPQVLAELRDPRAREHFQKLGTEGVEIFVKSPDVVSYSKVTAAAKKSGDFSVLSQTDLMLLALTMSMHTEHERQSSESAAAGPSSTTTPNDSTPLAESDAQTPAPAQSASEPSTTETSLGPAEPSTSTLPDLSTLTLDASTATEEEHPSTESDSSSHPKTPPTSSSPLFEDPPTDEDDDGEGEWITPDNVASHKSRAMFSVDAKKTTPAARIGVGCMTADFAMQNVLLHMGLALVSPEGKRITTVKTWVLRCHACFKLCKDQTKKFCPSCGNATLIRASVSTKAAPPGSSESAIVQVHLKSNFQYRNRGTIYSIPASKPGNAKGTNHNIILREDQIEFQRGLKSEAVRARKEEKKIASALAARDALGGEAGEKTWMDPDWMPDMMLGQSSRRGSALPDVGYGRKNPNEVRKKKR